MSRTIRHVFHHLTPEDEITVIPWGSYVYPPRVVTRKMEYISISQFHYGGTVIQSVLQYIVGHTNRYDVIIMATDGYVLDFQHQSVRKYLEYMADRYANTPIWIKLPGNKMAQSPKDWVHEEIK